MCACDYFLDTKRAEVFKAMEEELPSKMASF